MSVHRIQILLLSLVLLSTPLFARACEIVYGSDWSFMLEPPEKWNVACGKDAMEGTSITLWPSEPSSNGAQSLMYVSVSKKKPAPLEAFVEDEQVRYSQKEKLTTNPLHLELPASLSNVTAFAFRLSPAAPARQEYIAYIEGPTAYFILVLSSNSEEELIRRRENFFFALEHFTPMKIHVME